MVMVEPGDSVAVLERETGFPILRNLLDGARYGQPDFTPSFKALEEHTEEDWLKVLRVDLLGAFFFTRQSFLRMERGGAVVNVSSIHAEETTPLVASYAAAKAALVSLTRSAAIEEGGRSRSRP